MKGRLLQYSYLWLSSLLIIVSSVGTAQVTITVVDEDELPMIGVLLRTDNAHETTDLQGQATISISEAAVLNGEFLGYEDFQITKAKLKALGYRVSMIPADQILDEIVIIGRTDAREIDLPYNVEHISSDKIFSSNAQNSADALGLNSEAYIQKSQLGGGSPILRGFEANKILLVVDGVRMNNAIYRNGHLQNSLTIDPAILDQLEVIYGAGSLLYGSEALGGVIHFRTKTPLLDLTSAIGRRNDINSHIRYNTADQERTIHVDHSFSTRKFGVLSSVTYSNRSDLRMGTNRSETYPEFGLRTEYIDPVTSAVIQNPNPNVQIGTGYSQLDVLQKWNWRMTEKFRTELNLQYSTSSDVPRYDALTERNSEGLRFAEWYYGPQNRLLISPKFIWDVSSSLSDRISVISSFQDIKETRVTRGRSDINWDKQEETVQVYGLTIDVNKRLTSAQKLTYGADLHYNQVGSSAGRYATLSTDPVFISSILTRYPSAGSDLRNMGAYIQHNWQNSDSTLVWINGVRYSNQKTNMLYSRTDPFGWPAYFYEGITSYNAALVGITGLNYTRGPWKFKTSTGTAFRSPNVDDLAKIRVKGDEITVPNPELDSEKVWNSELTVGYQSKRLTVGVTGFYTRLSDAIIRTNYLLPNGQDFFISATDTLAVTANVNAANGYIRGVSTNYNIGLTDQLNLLGSVSIQVGRSEDTVGNTEPLGHIPPTYGRSALQYEKNRVTITADWRFNAWKRISEYGGSVDNPEQGAIDDDGNEVGSPAWQIFGLSSQIAVTAYWNINLSLQNILDTHYRPFASGVSGAGRHLSIALRYQGSW